MDENRKKKDGVVSGDKGTSTKECVCECVCGDEVF